MDNLKNIHIGKLIETRWRELGISEERTCNFFGINIKEISDMFLLQSIDSNSLLKWSKLLEYDFFRIYTQHLILYSPPSASEKSTCHKSSLPQFRKNIYTKEIIDFVLEQIDTKKMTISEVIERYNIPKTTLYKWISKYQKPQKVLLKS